MFEQREAPEGCAQAYGRRIRLLALLVAMMEIIGLVWNANTRAGVIGSPRMINEDAIALVSGPYNAVPADLTQRALPGPAPGFITPFGAGRPAPEPMLSASAPESEDFLEDLARGAAGTDNTVILTAGNADYVPSILSLACNLKQLGLSHKFIVAALDQTAFEKLQAAGVPSYLETFHEKVRDSIKGGKYNTKAFRDITKLKSKAALRILSMGFDVLWSDSDIAWFRNPLPYMQNELVLHGAHVVIQSNAPDSERSNERFRINSGFYLVKSNALTQTAFEAIVADAQASALSEQPSFYKSLCGPNGEFRSGINACKAPVPALISRIQEFSPLELENPAWERIAQPRDVQKVITRLLPRKLFSSGTTGAKSKVAPETGIWALEDKRDILSGWPGIYILHNNWIEGLGNKMSRAKAKGLWFVDEDKSYDGGLKCITDE